MTDPLAFHAYARSAELYDALYGAEGKNYALEAATIFAAIDHMAPTSISLLDVACGTGRHLEHFATRMRCTGVDLSPAMVHLARQRCPDVSVTEGDMSALDLTEHFDVVTCLFSAIGYMKDVPQLYAAIASMADRLNPGGLLFVEPWLSPDQWEVGRVTMTSVDLPDLKAARANVAAREGDRAVLDFHYLVARPDGVESFTERHLLTLFTPEQYRDAFTAAGLTPLVDPYGLTGRGLVIGQRH